MALGNPPRRRRRRSYRSNAPRRHRRYRRNPNFLKGVSRGFLMDATYVTGGFFLTRLTAGYVVPMLPTFGFPDLARIAGKGLVAWGLGYAGKAVLGAHAGQLLMLGGFVEMLSDATRTYVSPFVPALADEMGVYPQLPMGIYPQLGNGYDNPYSVSMGNQFDEAS